MRIYCYTRYDPFVPTLAPVNRNVRRFMVALPVMPHDQYGALLDEKHRENS